MQRGRENEKTNLKDIIQKLVFLVYIIYIYISLYKKGLNSHNSRPSLPYTPTVLPLAPFSLCPHYLAPLSKYILRLIIINQLRCEAEVTLFIKISRHKGKKGRSRVERGGGAGMDKLV